MKTRSFLLQIAASHRSVRYNTDLPPGPSIQSCFFPSFEHDLVILETLINGGEGITSKRSSIGHLSQNTVVSQVLWQLVVSLKS